MAEKQTRAQRNTALKRRATAASLGMLLGAFALVATTSQQAGKQVSQAATPAAEAALVTGAGTSLQGTETLGYTVTATTTQTAQPTAAAVSTVTATAASHASTRQS